MHSGRLLVRDSNEVDKIRDFSLAIIHKMTPIHNAIYTADYTPILLMNYIAFLACHCCECLFTDKGQNLHNGLEEIRKDSCNTFHPGANTTSGAFYFSTFVENK